ncbi:hypothetical protein BU24DRAFT_376174 [Aaosphaeria arxii CBS 175.79]|uniref:JmjC domain-containing histone demethylation protein 1 n=1 Tax=Aaosphaeria arxii CBS 175.79 TaxID=1450172 RepID=A0A6A5XHF2_9PLEO|nr:uncharacterized protein BU24DRAFT_376174 [Aaosphaeria arxii CBS 175.79]KAF2012393.1 hypothetical protein BU24DRAFT_376174 [Aaosphaeria arxii CBS 175.79]
MRVSSFKSQYRQTPLRSATPPPPTYEPLSPVLYPIQPASADPAGGKLVTRAQDNNTYVVTHHTLYRDEARPSSLLLSPPAGSYSSPLSSVPHQRSQTHIEPALGSPIETLASAATSSIHPDHSSSISGRRRPQGPDSPLRAVTDRNAPALTASSRAPVEGNVFSYSDRPSKRARSEFMLSPQNHGPHSSRPATSHGPSWSYNVEQMVDQDMHIYHSNSATVRAPEESTAKRLSDAQLLLDFHHAISSSQIPHAQPHALHNTVVISHNQHLNDTGILQEARASKTDPPVYGFGPAPFEIVPTSNGQSVPVVKVDETGTSTTIQTHTPPDDSIGITIRRTEAVSQAIEDKKPKRHQGWPKGKPRGPRTSSGTSRRKKSTPKPKTSPPLAPTSGTAMAQDQLQSPQSLPADRTDTLRSNYGGNSLATHTLQESGLHARRFSHSTLLNRSGQDHEPPVAISRARSVPVQQIENNGMPRTTVDNQTNHQDETFGQATICAGCRSSESDTMIGDGEQWISCDGCKGWFHFVCAGFKSEREVREIDKFYCNTCKPKYGDTTKVRKSGRAHTAVDYAGLNEGILKTSDDNPEHHYIQAFKNGDMEFTPESFARLPAECVHADFLEKLCAFTEPVVIPASHNPRPSKMESNVDASIKERPDHRLEEHYDCELVPNDGQDRIDMVIPDGLTVRRVSDLYGPHERVPVIDVKAQEGEDKRWTMAKWADYYEQQGEKPVRNVISLEVSRSKLGRLIRRPKVVRDMDLQDSVWPEDDKNNAPPVQFYCLMSVADCYTDFHIDFGGSSVYYHIVKGRKTFFFIQPTKQNLKKYEEWCLSPKQSHEFLGQQVKECYRVDLFPGDTMLIPSGWIHAVWTPEDSLVIGGNYLTRVHYGMQIKVVEIEKNTKVAPKFRYPFFQKIMWLSLLQYLKDDPIPPSVETMLLDGSHFPRSVPIYCETGKFGHNSHLGAENYNRRYYSKAELDGLPELSRYIWRTVLISLGKIDGITQVVRNAVTKSIPKGQGEPLALAQRFAVWVAWKRGNESIPTWAHPDAPLPEVADPKGEKKTSAAQIKRMEREALRETLKSGLSRNVRTRGSEPSPPLAHTENDVQPSLTASDASVLPLTGFLRPSREHVTTPKTSQLGPKRIACDACRKRRIRCKHKDDLVESPRTGVTTNEAISVAPSVSSSPASASLAVLAKRRQSDAESITMPPLQLPASEPRSILTGTPISTEINPEAWANKSNRVKACADCRKSKRRCIHDENGNIDPIKASETPVPRGSMSKKRRISGDNDEGEALNKKLKGDSFAGIINGEVSHYNRYPLARPQSQQDYNDDVAVHSAQQALTLASTDGGFPIDPQLSSDGLNEEQTSRDTTTTYDTIVSSIEVHPEGSSDGISQAEPIDPQFLGARPSTPTSIRKDCDNAVQKAIPTVTPPPIAGLLSTSPSHRPVKNENDDSFSRRPRSSRANGHPQGTRRSPSEHCYVSHVTKSAKKRQNSTAKLELGSEVKPPSTSPALGNKEDKASLALAMQLQIEEHGLRRRSK